MSRPAGVTVIAVLAAFTGIADVVAAGLSVGRISLPGVGGFADTFAVIGALVLGIVWALVGLGFWQGSGWARIVGLVWATLALVAALFALVAYLPVIGSVFVPIVLGSVVPLIVLWYLRRPEIRRWFEASSY
jgi:hypothetical protein